MKLLVMAAMIGLSPLAISGAAQAQAAAAGSVPNTFDRPAQAAPARIPTPAPAPELEATLSEPANAQSEEVLRTVIASAQAGTIDYALIDTALAARMREQEPRILPLLRSFGAVLAVDFVGSQEGADQFVVTFANATTEWVIGFNDAGKIDALLFRPVQS